MFCLINCHGIIGIQDLELTVEACRDILCPASSLALSVPFSALFGSVDLGIIREMPYPPEGNTCKEFKFHRGAVTTVKMHHTGLNYSNSSW